MARDAQGYTLVELVLVILIFSIVMTLISVSFNRIAASSTQIVKSAETDIGGMIGLELLRCDMELAGFGLPWSLPAGMSYREASSGVLVKGCQPDCSGADSALFNDATPVSVPPRAVVIGNNVGLNGSDYLVLKGTALGMSATSRSWSYLNYSSTGPIIKPSRSEVELQPGNGDRVIVERSGGTSTGVAIRQLVTNGPGSSSFSLVFNLPLPSVFWPTSKLDSFLVYGVAPADQGPLAFPFNRADYFISRPSDISSNCAPGTGVLYKTTINHNGTVTYNPILDCVADLQVFFYLDSNGDGEGDLHVSDISSPGGPVGALTAAALRDQLKEIRVYLLAQQGRKDPSFLYPMNDPSRVIVVGDAGLDQAVGTTLGSVWSAAALANSFGSDWRHYHWRLYTIVVEPKNL